ncbi:conjugal transfer protein [Streptomyces cyaneofuscatus]|uniref:conjugal transfer protein n=1 Tax=Streptomyces cyaneofuscatus TaxID=66883 RepID=UPI0036509236
MARRSARRVSLVRAGVWTVFAAGPVALLVAVAASSPPVPPPPARTTVAATSQAADPAGVAELFCDLWLRADAGADAASATVRAVRSLAPDVALPEGLGQSGAVLRTTAVRSAQLTRGTWSVVVAAQFPSATVEGTKAGTGRTVRYFAVPVASSDAGSAGGFTVTGAPAEVTGPGGAGTGASKFTTALPDDGALAASLGEFFNAYLVGVGEVGRYLAPGTRLEPVLGAGYASVDVEEVLAESDEAEGAVPVDGTRIRVRVSVRAVDAAGGRWPLAYELSVTSRSGRWEVSALRSGADAAVGAGAVGGAGK